MDIFAPLADYIKANWVNIVAIIIIVEKALRVADKLLPANITVDNDIADIIAKIIRAVAPEKKTV